MKYADLIQFHPVESIIQLTSANNAEKEAEYVRSYVMSGDMAEKLKINMLSQLRLDEVVDNKGVLLVGNYGTGKSHLMSLVSAVARDEGYLELVQNREFASDAACIAGKFEVLRIEIGASQMSLRNIILTKVQQDFAERGLSFSFPDEREIISNKDILFSMMELFGSRYPDKGYLIVVDELLDYLSVRKEQEVKLDLVFLRELGEAIRRSRLRAIFGLQEKLFGNPGFAFVSQTLNRVKDRFEQVMIRKEDTAYVVSERILRKDARQKALIREHLSKFCSLYSNMSERMEEFVELFPIHPSYIDVFNRIYIVENRHILKNISEIIRRILQQEVPEDAPGIISFDSYWSFIKENMGYRTDPNIREVVEKGGMLEDILNRSFPALPYKPLALQIIHALCVHRLTTGDVTVRAGLTSENLRDDLCLYLNGMPDQSSDTLQSIVQATLRTIMTTVSGQFVEHNAENGQYYLDLKKDIDYDEKIAQRAAVIDDDKLDGYFFDIVYYCLDWDAKEHVVNFKIYEHTLNWASHNVFRKGYLFLGPPESRPTAQPPEDYYIYFLPPYSGEPLPAQQKSDEVFFRFIDNGSFKNTLKLYAASVILRELADEKNKSAYHGKAEGFRRTLTRFLSENKAACFEVIYQKDSRSLLSLLGDSRRAQAPFKDAVDLAASLCLEGYFTGKYPEYPTFSSPITLRNMAEMVQAGIARFAGRKTQQSDVLLEGFGLLEEGKISVADSRYAQYYINRLSSLPAGGAVNFSDIYEETYDGCIDKKFKLSSWLLPMVFLAMVYTGNAVIALKSGSTLTASELDCLPRLSPSEVLEFRYIAKPKDVQLAELSRLFQVLDIPAGLILNPAKREEGLEKLLAKAKEASAMAAKAASRLQGSFSLWGERLVADHIGAGYLAACRRVDDLLGSFHIRFNTVAKLPNFTDSAERIDQLSRDLGNVRTVLEYDAFQSALSGDISYIMNVENCALPDRLKAEIREAKKAFRRIRDAIPTEGSGESAAAEVRSLLSRVKKSYIDAYYDEHDKKRLGLRDGERRAALLGSPALGNLRKLQHLNIFSSAKVAAIEEELSSLTVCYELTPEILKTSHYCTNCGLRMGSTEEPVTGKLEALEERIAALAEEWTQNLCRTLSHPLLQSQIAYLDPREQELLNRFLHEKKLPTPVDGLFVEAVSALLQGIEPVVIPAGELADKLDALGPCEMDVFRSRLEDILAEYTKGKDREKLRIVVKR